MGLLLQGKIALVTGASRGIGRSTAVGLARAGADVIVASRKLADIENTADEVRSAGRKALAVAAHVGRPEEINSLVDRVKRQLGRIDILVNNAGTSPAMAEVLNVDERLWDSVMNTNLKGLFFLSQAVGRLMKESGGGTIVNVSSVHAYRPDIGASVYSISKSGVEMVTKVMALELAQYHIRVNAIAPGNVHTRLGDARFVVKPGYEKEILDRTPLRRIADPEELVKTMIYLASDASSYMTGQTIIVDGGMMLV